MNWAREIALEIIAKRPNEEIYNVACGVSPSGFIHIGNFREIVTPYMIATELRELGKKVRFFISVDNYDRFRKVPAGVPETCAEHIGKPYVGFASPFNPNKTYAEEFQERFLAECEAMGVHFDDVIYQATEYQSGRYSKKIKFAMDKRGEIFDIIDSFRTQDAEEGARENYYPISIYCETCGKDSTRVLSYDEKTGDFTYECDCGHKHTGNVLTAKNIKLPWKIDWPMRWGEENVVFETGGLDHSTAGGSHDVAEAIAKKIFGITPPVYHGYNFISSKGGSAKMSSSKGGVTTLSSLLSVYDKHIIMWFYSKYKPNQSFFIALDNDVIRFYSEFDRWVKAYFENRIDEGNRDFIRFSGVTEDYLKNPNFTYLATFLPIVNFNEKMLAEILEKEGIDTTTTQYKERLERAKFWVTNYGTDYQVNVLSNKNVEYYSTLNDIEKNWLVKTVDILQNDYATTTDLQNTLYAVVKTEELDESQLKQVQKRYFEILYQLLLGTSKGPKLGLFLTAIGKDKATSLLKF